METNPPAENPYKDMNNFVLSLPGSEQRQQMAEMGLLETRIGDVETECSPQKSALTYGQWLQAIDKAIIDCGLAITDVESATKKYLDVRDDASFQAVAELIQPVIDKLKAEGYSDFDIKG
jgi:hypothetical protein